MSETIYVAYWDYGNLKLIFYLILFIFYLIFISYEKLVNIMQIPYEYI